MMNSGVKAAQQPIVRTRARALDYIELMKPELTFLSVLTALAGLYLGNPGAFDPILFLHVAVGTMLVGAGAGALNQFMERDFDRLMKRTERRPLPSGRLLPSEALVFGILLSVCGVCELTIFAGVLTGFLSVVTSTTYLFLYTPLKRITPMATVIGGIPGALPPLMGWAAARHDISWEAWILGAVLFCWQMPHFHSLAWLYRKDYGRAGFKMLSVLDADGTRTARHILLFTAALALLSLVPAAAGAAGSVYTAGASVLGASFLGLAVVFARSAVRSGDDAAVRSNRDSRRLFAASLIYLPLLLALMVADKT